MRFLSDEFESAEARVQGNEWEWDIEPECCDLELLGMGPDEALDYLSDLVIVWQTEQ